MGGVSQPKAMDEEEEGADNAPSLPAVPSDDVLAQFMNDASRWGDVEDEVAVKFVQVVPCLPGLALMLCHPRCARTAGSQP